METTNAMLMELLMQRMPEPGHYPTSIPGVVLHRRDVPNAPEIASTSSLWLLPCRGPSVRRWAIRNIATARGIACWREGHPWRA